MKRWSKTKLAVFTFVICCQIWSAIDFLMIDQYTAAVNCLLILVLFFILEMAYRTTEYVMNDWRKTIDEHNHMVEMAISLEVHLRRELEDKDKIISQLRRSLKSAANFINDNDCSNLLEALKKYGQHQPACTKVLARMNGGQDHCSCGFDEVVCEG